MSRSFLFSMLSSLAFSQITLADVPKFIGTTETKAINVACKFEKVLSLTLENGDRAIGVCQDLSCTNVEILFTLSRADLKIVSKFLSSSIDQKNQTIATTLFGISDQQASYMIQSGVDAKVLMVGEYKTIIGDKTDRIFKGVKVFGDKNRVIDSIRGKGESWRECDALPSLKVALVELVKEMKKNSTQFDQNELKFTVNKLNGVVSTLTKSIVVN